MICTNMIFKYTPSVYSKFFFLTLKTKLLYYIYQVNRLILKLKKIHIVDK